MKRNRCRYCGVSDPAGLRFDRRYNGESNYICRDIDRCVDRIKRFAKQKVTAVPVLAESRIARDEARESTENRDRTGEGSSMADSRGGSHSSKRQLAQAPMQQDHLNGGEKNEDTTTNVSNRNRAVDPGRGANANQAGATGGGIRSHNAAMSAPLHSDKQTNSHERRRRVRQISNKFAAGNGTVAAATDKAGFVDVTASCNSPQHFSATIRCSGKQMRDLIALGLKKPKITRAA